MKGLHPTVMGCAAWLLALVAPSMAHAAWRAGAEAGVNVTSFHSRDAVGYESVVSPSGGVRVEHEWTALSLVGSILYSERGAKGGGPGGTIILDASSIDPLDRYQLGYVEVPLLLKVPLPRGDDRPLRARGAGAYLVAGVSFGVSTGGHQTPAFRTASESIDHLRAVDTGLTGGLGFAFPAGDGGVGFEVRYTEGVSDLNANPWVSGVRNTAFSFRLFILRS